MKFTLTAKNFLFLCAMLLTMYAIVLTFNSVPDVTFWKWFGWNYGINYTDHMIPKLLAMGAWVLYILVPSPKDTELE